MKPRYFALSLIAGPLLATSSSAATIQFDISNNTAPVPYVGSQSPGHTAGDVTGTTWNTVEGDTASGSLLWDDGTVASTVQFDVGNGTPTINWANGLSVTSNSAATTAIYDTSLMRDWHYSSNNNNLGVRVNGLAPGEYRVYALLREPNQLSRTYDVNIGINQDTFNGAGLVENTSIGDAAGVTTWTDGMNYASTDVTVASLTDYVTVIVDPTNAAWGTIAGMQIVAIPEPSAFALFGIAGLGLIARRRR